MRDKITYTTKPSIRQFLLKHKITALLLVVNIALMGALLMFMMGSDSQGVNIGSYTNQINALNIQNQQIQESIAQNQSIANLSTQAGNLGLVPVQNIVYMPVNTNLGYNMNSTN